MIDLIDQRKELGFRARKMNSGVVKDFFGIYEGLERRTSGFGLLASDGINIKRITNLIRYKSHKNDAMLRRAMKLDSFESVKEHVLWSTQAEAAVVACSTICRYSLGIGMETIANATFKGSKVLNGWGAEKRAWGRIADPGFKPANRTLKLQGIVAEEYDWTALCSYVFEAFGVPEPVLGYLADYAGVVFNIDSMDAITMANQVMVVEKIVEAAFKASRDLDLLRRRVENPTDSEINREKTMVGEDEYLKECQKEFSDDVKVNSLKPGFLQCREEMCIFMDCKEARFQYKLLMHLLDGSFPDINWARMTRFMEYKARKEYAMETYGVRLGDFHSLKENAFRLFEITEAEAETMASQTMAMDSESIVFEKIADAAFKASKILNWEVDVNQRPREVWDGNIADASGFKSPKSMKNFCTNMDIEARKAYTIEAFGVSSVEINYIKDFAIHVFRVYNEEELTETEAIIMACDCVAVDHVVEAACKNLNLTLELEPMDEEEARAMPVITKPPFYLPVDYLFDGEPKYK